MSSERRRSFRSPVIGSREAVLIVGSERLPVHMLDESAEGLSVSAESMPRFPEGIEGSLECEGALTRVEIVHIQPRGAGARIGLQRLSITQPGEKDDDLTSRRRGKSRMQVAMFVVVGMAVGIGAQADPIRRQLVKVPGVGRMFSSVNPADGAVTPKISSTLREKLRDKFDIDLFAEPEMSVLLQLRDDQRSKIKSILDAKNAALRGKIPASQQSAVLYITQLAMLGVLNTEQKYRLESLVEHTIGATELLQKLVTQYWPNADAAELYNRLGAPALALPQVACKINLDEKQLKAIRLVVDQALDRSEELYKQAKSGPNESELLQTAYGYITQAHDVCLSVLTPEQQEALAKMARKEQ